VPFSLFSVNPHNNPQLHQTTLELLLKTRADNATLTFGGMISKRYPLPIRAVSIIFSQEIVPVGKSVGRGFCSPLTCFTNVMSVAMQLN